MRGAYFEVISDLVTFLGVTVAAIAMWTTGWYYADPLISVVRIGLFILPRDGGLDPDWRVSVARAASGGLGAALQGEAGGGVSGTLRIVRKSGPRRTG